MVGMVSSYPRVTEWLYLGNIAVNLAQVASIEFGHAGNEAQAIVRLSSYRVGDDGGQEGKTWFRVAQVEVVGALRRYVDDLRAAGFAANLRG